MTGTLGGLIKDLRLQKSLSQLEVALAIGWKDSSILSRIEQGVVNKPKREVIEKLSIVLQLSTPEKNHLLLSGNYLPNKAEIDEIRREVDSLINNWKYPATAYDFSWRVIHENEICRKIYYETEEEADKVRKTVPNVFELNFDENFSQNKYASGEDKTGIEKERIQSLMQYRAEQKKLKSDENINDLIKVLISNESFRKTWETTQQMEPTNIIDNYTYADYVVPARGKKESLVFHLFNVPLLHDPRINIEFHTPANKKTFEYFENKQ